MSRPAFLRLKDKLRRLDSTNLILLFSLCGSLNMIDSVFSYYLFDFLNVQAKIDGSIVGMMLFSSECFNIFVGPLASYVISNYFITSIGPHRYWMFTALPFLLISFLCLWIIPPFGLVSLIIYYSTVLFFFTSAYGLLLIAYEGCIPLMFSDEYDLARVNSFRLLVGSVSSIFSVFLGVLLSPMPSQFRYFVLGIIICISITICYWTFLSSTEEKHADCDLPEEESMQRWTDSVKRMFRKKDFVILTLNHFFIWVIIIAMNSTIQSYIRDYLLLDETYNWYCTPSSVAVLVTQFGSAVVQIGMATYPELLTQKVMIRYGLAVTTVSSLLFVSFSAIWTNTWMIFGICFISGCGVGALFTSYEIMVPEVINRHSNDDGEMLENVVYGMVDSIREIALSLTFLLVGLVSSDVSLPIAMPMLMGYLPVAVCVVLTGLYHLYSPYYLRGGSENGAIYEQEKLIPKVDNIDMYTRSPTASSSGTSLRSNSKESLKDVSTSSTTSTSIIIN